MDKIYCWKYIAVSRPVCSSYVDRACIDRGYIYNQEEESGEEQQISEEV